MEADYQQKLSDIMNDTENYEATIDDAEAKLKEIRRNVYSFETDSGKADMITGKVLASLQWSVMQSMQWIRPRRMILS